MRCGFLLIFTLLTSTYVFAQNSALEGRVIDQTTRQPLEGATVTIPELQKGAVADSSGFYRITGLEQGTYTVKFSYVGYAPFEAFETRIESGVNQLDAELAEQAQETEAVEITANFFNRNNQQLNSTKRIGLEQIRSNPGGNDDISRVLQSLPGVSGSVGFRNDIIVRGGGPSENVFFLDGIEIPNLNHFATQGAGGGPLGILNANFIQSVDFQSSAFGSQYDNTLSSVLSFEFQEGNRKRFQTTAQVGASEAGLTFDFPVGEKITALFSVRRSYLQFLFEVIGLPFLPDYWDGQAKIKYNITPRTSLTYIGVGAIDRITVNDRENVDIEDQPTLDGFPKINQDSYTQGIVLKQLLKKGFFTVALSRNGLFNDLETEDPISGENNTRFNSSEIENKLRVNVQQRLGQFELRYGGVVQYVGYTADSRAIIGIPGGSGNDTIVGSSDINFFQYGAHIGLSRSYFKRRLRTNIGLRADMNSFTNNGNNPLETLSPRASFSFAITSKLAWNGSIGRYYQLPSYPVLGYNEEGDYLNRDAEYIGSTHFTTGFEYQPISSLVVGVDGFLKLYDNYPVSLRDSISLANKGGGFGVLGNEPVVSNGEGRSYGLEVYAQKRLTKNFYGIFAYTLFWSEFTNLGTEKFVSSTWDNRHLVSFTGGWQFRLGKNNKKTWELAGKWRFLGGTPYTPFDIPASVQLYPVRGEGVVDYDFINTER
ncbi:MAG: TonB-dependent receptor, partial [Bacteroidota bacterium]